MKAKQQISELDCINIIGVYTLADKKEITEGKNWYRNANSIAKKIKKNTNVALPEIIGVISALSPSNRWDKNVLDAERICKEFSSNPKNFKNTVKDLKVSTYSNNKDKAVRILHTKVCRNIVTKEILKILNGNKTVSFFKCIQKVNSSNAVVIDGHAKNIFYGKRQTLDKTNVTKKEYEKISDAYIKATDIINKKNTEEKLLPHQLQAITWLTWRRLHNI